jgi:polyisoprenoid-binding protein YceI
MLTGFSNLRALALGLPVCLALSAAFAADTPPPMKIPHGQKDISLADSGTYTLDTNHVAILARVSHLSFSVSVFRFGAAKGTLDWDAKNPVKSKLSATVETASIETNVPGFAEELQGAQYLNAKAFPQATFVSTAFRQTDAQHGDVDGNFTLKGVTKPVTFKVTLIGAGPGFAGGPVIGHVIGIHAETSINGADYGVPQMLNDQPIVLQIDTEFDKAP